MKILITVKLEYLYTDHYILNEILSHDGTVNSEEKKKTKIAKCATFPR